MTKRESAAYNTSGLDNVGPGPRRWERAARNAALRPHTQHAKLFFERVAVSRTVVLRDVEPGPREHCQFGKRMYWTCGAEHAARQLALDLQTTDIATIVTAMNGTQYSQARLKHGISTALGTPDREVGCRVCGIVIQKTGILRGFRKYKVDAEDWIAKSVAAASDDATRELPALAELMQENPPWAPAPDANAYVIDDDGELVPLANTEIRIVRLTAGEYEIAKLLDSDGIETLLEQMGETYNVGLRTAR